MLAANTTIHGFDTNGGTAVPLVSVAVAHPGGIGSIYTQPIVDITRLPPIVASELMRRLDGINEMVRPRTKDKRNVYAVRLTNAIIRPISNFRPET